MVAMKYAFKFPAVFDHCLLMNNINELWEDSLCMNNNGIHGYRDQFLCRFWSEFVIFALEMHFQHFFRWEMEDWVHLYPKYDMIMICMMIF